MQAWSNKKQTETRTRTYVLPNNMRSNGVTIVSINSVSAAVHELSPVSDTDPSAILSGSPQIITTPFVTRSQAVGANQAVIQNITAGIVGCLYVITFNLQLSTGEIFIEDTTQMIVEYVPSPSPP